jgi:aldose 1-epimerase
VTDSLPRSGPQFELRAGRYRAGIAAVGASLRSLTFADRDLVLPYGPDEVRPRYRGALLAPWPNRVADGRWRWRGEQLQLALNEPARGHAIHGLVDWVAWTPVEQTPCSLALQTTIWPQAGYPFRLRLTSLWQLDDEGLRWTLTAGNDGAEDAPYGCSIHPYLVAPGGRVDDWTASVPAAQRLEVDERLVPLKLVDAPADADFRRPRRVGEVFIDHAYRCDPFDGVAEASVTDASGQGAVIRFGAGTPWLQVHTADESARAGLALEPMSCPPDALRSGTDLVVLAPGEEHAAWWQLAALG